MVPVSNHLMDTESEFAPWDLSKAHILVSTPAEPNGKTAIDLATFPFISGRHDRLDSFSNHHENGRYRVEAPSPKF